MRFTTAARERSWRPRSADTRSARPAIEPDMRDRLTFEWSQPRQWSSGFAGRGTTTVRDSTAEIEILPVAEQRQDPPRRPGASHSRAVRERRHPSALPSDCGRYRTNVPSSAAIAELTSWTELASRATASRSDWVKRLLHGRGHQVHPWRRVATFPRLVVGRRLVAFGASTPVPLVLDGGRYAVADPQHQDSACRITRDRATRP